MFLSVCLSEVLNMRMNASISLSIHAYICLYLLVSIHLSVCTCTCVSYISNKPPLVGEHAFLLTEFVARRLTLHLNGINQVNYVLHSAILI